MTSFNLGGGVVDHFTQPKTLICLYGCQLLRWPGRGVGEIIDLYSELDLMKRILVIKKIYISL